MQRRDRKRLWQAPSTIGDLLRREGLSAPRRRRRTAMPVIQPFLPIQEPNDLWWIDFRGWFHTADGQRCDPLIIADADSRFLIECRIVPETIAAVQCSRSSTRPSASSACRGRCAATTACPCEGGGTPFASGSAVGGLTRLSVHWIKLGIRLERAHRSGGAATEWPA